MSEESMLKEISELAKVFGDPNRLTILHLLMKRQMCVNALAEKLKISQPAVSQHLKVLKSHKIISAKKVGLQMHYTINKETLERFHRKFDTCICRCENKSKK